MIFQTRSRGQTRESVRQMLPCEDAGMISDYIKQNYNGSIYAICGLSGSWDITSCLLSEKSIYAGQTIVETGELEPGELVLSMMK